MKTQTLHYYMHDGPTTFRFELSGRLDREGACRLDQDWRTASSVLGDRRLIVDLTFVMIVDEEGRALLAGWHRVRRSRLRSHLGRISEVGLGSASVTLLR